MITVELIITSAVVAAIVTGFFTLAQVIINKRVQTPADKENARRAELVERNEILKEYRDQLTDARGRIDQLEKSRDTCNERIDAQDKEIDTLKEQALSRDHYIYRCIGVIDRNLGREFIPMPIPPGMEL